jgi:hypothetical protein
MPLLISSKLQTKSWRKNQEWYNNGKHNECEKYQRQLINKITGKNIYNTKIRLNIFSYELKNISNPNVKNDGFEWSENFDGYIEKDDKKFYFNLKFTCDKGGAQTRTLREVYMFINAQINHIKKFQKTNTFIINILDGDESYRNMNKMSYRINMHEKYKKYIFIGDMAQFEQWWNSH